MKNIQTPSLDEIARDPSLAASLDLAARCEIMSRCARIQTAIMIWPWALPGGNVAEPPLQPDRLLEVAEAAAMLKVCTMTLYRSADRYPFTRRIGRRLRFSESGIRRFITEGDDLLKSRAKGISDERTGRK
jgi:predicted DNA-binding transcriptional regulator AlpA